MPSLKELFQNISSNNNATKAIEKHFQNFVYIRDIDEVFDKLFRFHEDSKKINLKKSQHLKAGLMALLKNNNKVMKLRGNHLFRLSTLPRNPGVWDDDIIKALFRNKLVFVPNKVRDTLPDWPYFMRDPRFLAVIVDGLHSKASKAEYEVALRMYHDYRKLRQQNRSFRILHPDGPWEVHFWSNRSTRNAPWTVVLPRKRINRNNKINVYYNIKEHPETKVVIHSNKEKNTSFWNKATLALEMTLKVEFVDESESCPYTRNILYSLDNKSIAIALNNGIVVGAFSWEMRGQSLHIKYLCSSKLVPNIGTALLYAAEEFARYYNKKRVYLLAAANAKPFYFKVGYNYLSDASSEATGIRSKTITGASRKTNSNSNNNTATSKRKLILPTNTNRKMRRYV